VAKALNGDMCPPVMGVQGAVPHGLVARKIYIIIIVKILIVMEVKLAWKERQFSMIIGLASLTPLVGKTTVANHLQDKHDYEPIEMSDPIIWIGQRFFGFKDKINPEDRKLLQDIGLAAKLKQPDIWFYYCLLQAELKYKSKSINENILNFTHDRLQSFKSKIESEGLKDAMYEFFHSDVQLNGINFDGEYVYSDRTPAKGIIMGGVRSPFEADEILKVGGKVYLVENERVDGPDGDHEVESQLNDYSKFTGVIKNNGTFEELYYEIDNMIDSGVLSNG